MSSKFNNVIAVLFCAFFLMAPPAGAEEKINEVKCHKCKEQDLKYVLRHKKIGYDGCLKCHTSMAEKKEKPPKKEEKKKEPQKKK